MKKIKSFYYYYFYCFYQLHGNYKLVKKKKFEISSVLYSSLFMSLTVQLIFLSIQNLLIILFIQVREFFKYSSLYFSLIFLLIFFITNSIFFLIKGKKIVLDFDNKIQLKKKDVYKVSLIPLISLITMILLNIYVRNNITF